MKNTERVREALLGTPGTDYFRQRAFAGWKPVAIIWEREIGAADEAGSPYTEDVPFGLQVAADATSLEENAKEKAILLEVMDGVIQDKRISQIAADLNSRGRQTRSGGAWSAIEVFHLLPRLIEVGPRVFPTKEWAERRERLLRAVC